MSKILIFTGLTKLGKVQLGEALDYVMIAKVLNKAGHSVSIVCSGKTTLKGIDTIVYQDQQIEQLVNKTDIIIVGSYAPTKPLFFANKFKKKIILKLYEPAPIASLEFNDFKNLKDNNQVSEYCVKALKYHLSIADYILYPSENSKYYYLGLLTAVGRLNTWQYSKDKNFEHFMCKFSHGVPSNKFRKIKGYYSKRVKEINKNDFIILWNGGIWNWYDTDTLIKAVYIAIKKNPKIKLVFQGYKHPDMDATKTAKQSIALAKKYKLINKNIFFFDTWVEHARRHEYLSDAQLAVISSENILDSHFGVRNRIFDHLWSKTPVILTDNDSFASEIIENNLGYTVGPKNVKELSEIILCLSKSKKLQNSFEDNIVKYNKDNTYNKLLKPLVEFCSKPKKSVDLKYISDVEVNKLLQDFNQSESLLSKLRKN